MGPIETILDRSDGLDVEDVVVDFSYFDVVFCESGRRKFVLESTLLAWNLPGRRELMT